MCLTVALNSKVSFNQRLCGLRLQKWFKLVILSIIISYHRGQRARWKAFLKDIKILNSRNVSGNLCQKWVKSMRSFLQHFVLVDAGKLHKDSMKRPVSFEYSKQLFVSLLPRNHVYPKSPLLAWPCSTTKNYHQKWLQKIPVMITHLHSQGNNLGNNCRKWSYAQQ